MDVERIHDRNVSSPPPNGFHTTVIAAQLQDLGRFEEWFSRLLGRNLSTGRAQCPRIRYPIIHQWVFFELTSDFGFPGRHISGTLRLIGVRSLPGGFGGKRSSHHFGWGEELAKPVRVVRIRARTSVKGSARLIRRANRFLIRAANRSSKMEGPRG